MLNENRCAVVVLVVSLQSILFGRVCTLIDFACVISLVDFILVMQLSSGCVLEVLRMTHSLVSFGAYTSVTSLQDLIGSLVKLPVLLSKQARATPSVSIAVDQCPPSFCVSPHRFAWFVCEALIELIRCLRLCSACQWLYSELLILECVLL